MKKINKQTVVTILAIAVVLFSAILNQLVAFVGVAIIFTFIWARAFILKNLNKAKSYSEKEIYDQMAKVFYDTLPVFLLAFSAWVFAALISYSNLPDHVRVLVSLILLLVFALIFLIEAKKFVSIVDIKTKPFVNGLRAERVAGENLKKIPELLRIANFNMGHGDIDNICICHKGVFIVEVKSHEGVVSYKDGVLLKNGFPFEKDFIAQVRGQIDCLRELIKNRFGWSPFVNGIIEFENAQRDTSLNGPKDGVWIGGKKFSKWVIEKRGTGELTTGQINAIYKFLSEEKAKQKI